MIVVKLMGGLGNQMFQYAAGKALALKHGVPLLVDETFLNTDPSGAYTKREPELAQLNVKLQVADEQQLKFFERTGFWDKLFKSRKNEPDVLFEGAGFNPDFFKAGAQVYLNGFWQSEKYFLSCREVLLREFIPAYDLQRETGDYLSNINNAESVAVHVRRGDYASLKSAGDFHGLLTMDYYKKAFDLLRNRIPGCRFFVFSDDLNWCRQNFKSFPGLVYVETASAYASADLFLMTACRHHIIANSSYSWWGAWLNTNKDNITLAPQKWLLDGSRDTSHIYSKNWIRI